MPVPWDGHVPLLEHRAFLREIVHHWAGCQFFLEQTRGVGSLAYFGYVFRSGI